MKKNKKNKLKKKSNHLYQLVLILTLLIVAIFAWAPWMTNDGAAARYIIKKYQMPGIAEEMALLIAQTTPAEYDVSWTPFGRTVSPKGYVCDSTPEICNKWKQESACYVGFWNGIYCSWNPK